MWLILNKADILVGKSNKTLYILWINLGKINNNIYSI